MDVFQKIQKEIEETKLNEMLGLANEALNGNFRSGITFQFLEENHRRMKWYKELNLEEKHNKTLELKLMRHKVYLRFAK